MKFLADESVDRQIVSRLRNDGLPVLSVMEENPGIPDDEVLNMANQEEAILITADKDFGELVFRHRRVSAGVVLIRLAGLAQEKKAELVSSAVREQGKDFRENFTVISPGLVRIRRRR